MCKQKEVTCPAFFSNTGEQKRCYRRALRRSVTLGKENKGEAYMATFDMLNRYRPNNDYFMRGQ